MASSLDVLPIDRVLSHRDYFRASTKGDENSVCATKRTDYVNPHESICITRPGREEELVQEPELTIVTCDTRAKNAADVIGSATHSPRGNT